MGSTSGAAEDKARGRRKGSDGRLGYRLMYRLGITPWDRGLVPPELTELVEGPDVLPRGRALDLGCGTGTQAVYLARSGWQVVGIDFTARALVTARHRAEAAGTSASWVQGDVSRLSELGIETGFGLVLDYGCFHGLTEGQREGYAEGVRAVSTSDATFLLNTFVPGRRGPAPRGASREEIERRFGDAWEVLWERKADWVRLPAVLRNADPTTYCLRRR